MSDARAPTFSRRRLFEIIGASVGGAAAYQAMTCLGYAEESPYRGPVKLDGDPKGASVVILGPASPE
jgi:monoamine oxidase